MHTSPATESARKPSRSKAKAAAGAPVAKSHSRKKPRPDTEVEAIAQHPTPGELKDMIATAAYFMAAERHFAAGHDLDDWLEAERRVQAQLAV